MAVAAVGGRRVDQGWPFVRFVAMGGAASLTYGVLFLLLGAVTELSDVVVTVVATIVSTVVSNELHRRFTFRSTAPGSVARGQRAGSGMALVGLVANSLAVAAWNALVPGAGAVATLIVVYCVNGLVGLVNFGVLRRALAGGVPAPAAPVRFVPTAQLVAA